MDIKQRFGSRVRELRKEMGYSQEEFAEVCKVHRAYMGRVERGLANATLETVERLAKGLGVGVEVLFMSK